jgi:hypothetical protein
MCVREARIDNSEDATSKASPSVLPCQADGNFLPSLVGLMNMMTRVNKRRVSLVLFLAMLSWLGTAAVPVCAKENISIGTAGDPGDGLDFSSGGGTDDVLNGDGGAANQTNNLRSPLPLGIRIALVPYFDASGLHFVVINIAGPKVESPK